MPEDLMDRTKEWTEQNPLRSFRSKRGMTIFTAASLLRVSITAIQMWENGTNHPTDENMQKIAELTANANVAQDWVTWTEARPSV